jgi:hypothetical protein
MFVSRIPARFILVVPGLLVCCAPGARAPTAPEATAPDEEVERADDEPQEIVLEPTFVGASPSPLPRVAPSDAGSPPSAEVAVSNAEGVIRTQIHPAAKRCYQASLNRAPLQAGRVVILVTVAPDGGVASVDVGASTGLSASALQCIVQGAATARFPAPGGAGAQISIPFNFVTNTPGGRAISDTAHALAMSTFPRARACFDRSHAVGESVYEVTVGAGGAAASVRTLRTSLDADTTRCISDALGRTNFPLPFGRRVVTPFVLGRSFAAPAEAADAGPRARTSEGGEHAAD